MNDLPPSHHRDDPTPRLLSALTRQLASLRGRSIVVGVSGGGDSVGLLRAVALVAPSLDLTVTVGHLDHGLRGDASTRDAQFVIQLAQSLALDLDLTHWNPAGARSIEAEARRARLAWLADLARDRNARAVLLGHTLDDQAETILHRLLRGTGLRGLAGIPRRRPLSPEVTLLRPLLDFKRDEIRAFLQVLQQPWCEDASNLDHSQTRARIRHSLLPLLAHDYNPRIVDALIRTARQARLHHNDTRRRVRKFLRHWSRPEPPSSTRLFLRRWHALSPAMKTEVLRGLWKDLGWPERAMPEAQWLRLKQLVDHGTGSTQFGRDVLAWVDASSLFLRFTTQFPAPKPEPVLVPVPGEAFWGPARLVVSTSVAPPPESDEVIDADSVRFLGSGNTLQLRPQRPGDRIAPLGLGGHTQRVRDVLRGHNVPHEARAAIPLLCDAEGVIWVVGHRLAERVRCTDNTRSRIGLRWETAKPVPPRDQPPPPRP